MAVIKAGKSGKSLARALNYAGREGITSGKDCPNNEKEALEQMNTTKDIYDQNTGRKYKSYIQSFSPKDKISAEKANQLGREWAEKCFPDYEVFIGTHTDRDHIHNHILVNSVNFENGKKIQVSKKDLERFKQENDRICLREELSIPEKGQRQEITTWTMNKHRLLERINNGEHVKSYVLDAAIAADQALHHSSSREEFIKNMERQGYKVNWQEQRKNITLIDPSGKKVRISNLEKTFSNPKFSKEGMEFEFQRSKEKRSRERQADTAKHSNPRGTSVERECSTERLGQISARSLEASRNYSVDKSISNIKRELQQLQARAGHGNQIAPRKNQLLNRKQLNLRESDQERDY
jgi:hypothetical protein